MDRFPIATKFSKERLGARNVSEVGQTCVYNGQERHHARVWEVALVLDCTLLVDGKRCGEDGEELWTTNVFETVEWWSRWRCPLHFHFGADACRRVERACHGEASSTYGERCAARRGGMLSRFWQHFTFTRVETRRAAKNGKRG
jgi:hypothetical protein